ncbi:MAG: hypothetical protein V1702_02315 [Candidatus Woesearchaeota archaeon]
MSIFEKISKLTYALLLVICLAFFSYTVFPQALYLIHKHFLGEYIAGLSLAKPLVFFAFLFAMSLARDLLPKKDFKLTEWTFYQVAIVVCLLLVGLFGFMVFNSHKETLYSLSPGVNTTNPNAGVWYANYEAKTMFFYSISKLDHYHENKAYFYPILKYTGIEGDIGESIYPFYPKMLMFLGYVLTALAMLAFVQSLRQLGWLGSKLDAFVFIYYTFTFARVVHVVFDGGLFLSYLAYDLAAFFSASILIAYLRYPAVKFTAFLPLASVVLAPYAGKAIQWGFAAAFEVKNPVQGTALPAIFFFETLLVFSAAAFLSQRRLEWKRMWRDMRNSKAKALLLILVVSVAYLYVSEMDAFNMRTALDDTASYMDRYKTNPSNAYLTVTSADPSNPCNLNPYKAFNISGIYVKIIPLNPMLKCESGSKFYSYPTSKYQPKEILYVVDCSTAKGSYSKKGDICYSTIKGNFTFFQFEAAQPLEGQQVYWLLGNAA